MVREYKALFITDEPAKAYEAKRAGRYVVLAFPLKECISSDEADAFPYVLEHADEVPDDYLDRLLLRFEGKPWSILETDRCRVREMTAEDVDALYEIYADSSVTAYMEALYENPEEERAYTRDYIRCHYGFYEFGMWIVEDKQTGRIIGRAGFDMVAEKELPQLGFLIRKDCRRQGLAEEVCRAILRYGSKELGFYAVEASCHKDNAASQRLLEKLGFVYIGRHKDEVMKIYIKSTRNLQ